MTVRLYGLLFILGVLVFLGVAALEPVPGYMDADYYYAMGLRIANNQGFSEPFLWNYLDDPRGIPHPAYTYWMPTAAVLAGLGIMLTGMQNFWGARFVFIVLSGSLVPITAYLAYSFHPKRWAAMLAAMLVLFSGFYFAYLPTTETFAINMVLGSLIFLLLLKMQKDCRIRILITRTEDDGGMHGVPSLFDTISPIWVYILIGVMAGLMYLTRSDGLIWLGIALLGIILQGISLSKSLDSKKLNRHKLALVVLPVIIFLISYLAVISPMLLRNLNSFGSIFAPGTSRALWLNEYDELFAYPASQLTSERWLDAGVFKILYPRAAALGMNLLNTLAVQGGILLIPLIIMGMWSRREDWRVGLGALAWLTIFLVMTLIFPYQGARGGFFHSGAALQPLFWALVPIGLMTLINWGMRIRRWDSIHALHALSVGLLGLMIIVTIFATWQRIIGRDRTRPAWGAVELAYREVGSYLDSNNASNETIVMVNNPPGFYAMTGRNAIVLPNGDLSVTLLAGKHYEAEYLVLDENHPKALVDIFTNPRDLPGLRYVDSIANMHIYKFME